MFTIKYGSIIVIDDIDYSKALPLFALRQNIYTDPQRPMRENQKYIQWIMQMKIHQ